MESNIKRNHTVTIEGRAKAAMSGVEKVVSAVSNAIVLATAEGSLTVQGKDLKINKFNVDDGSLTMEGEIDFIRYSAGKTPVLKRIFK